MEENKENNQFKEKMEENNQFKEENKENNQFKEKMIIEFTKFLDVYNKLSGSNYILDIRGEYDVFIRFLGNYIYKDFINDCWDNTHIKFSEEVLIDLSVFKNTQYYESVNNFLLSLKIAFFSSLDEDIYEYLNTTTEYTDEENRVCKEFYDRVSTLNNSLKKSTFSSKDSEILSHNNISTYSSELKEFNNYIHYVSSKRELYNLILHFDKKIRQLSKTKKYPEILFSV